MRLASHSRFDRSILRIIELAQASLQASASGFYWIDPALNMIEVSTVGMPFEFSQGYHSGGIGSYDPCFARRLAGQNRKLALLSDERTKVAPDAVEPYLALLRDFAFTDTTDMIFWRNGVPFAGLGVVKRLDDPPASEETVAVASALQHYFESELQCHPHMIQEELSRRFGLTAREVEVVNLLCGGASNSDIAKILGIGIATVKTHVLRCFDKVGVKSRFALLSFLSSLH